MSIEAELINSLKNIETRIDALTQKTAKAGQSLRVPMEDAAKAVKKVETNFDQFGTKMHHTANNLGAKIAEQLTGRLLAVLGPIALVDAGIGAISNRIEQNRQKAEATAQSAASFTRGTAGITADAPLMRKQLGLAANITPDDALAATNAYLAATGGKNHAPADIGNLAGILAKTRITGWDKGRVAGLVGRMTAAGVTGQQTQMDLLADLIDSGDANDEKHLSRGRLRARAGRTRGAYGRYVAAQRFDDSDVKLAALDEAEARLAWNDARSPSALNKRLEDVNGRLKDAGMSPAQGTAGYDHDPTKGTVFDSQYSTSGRTPNLSELPPEMQHKVMVAAQRRMLRERGESGWDLIRSGTNDGATPEGRSRYETVMAPFAQQELNSRYPAQNFPGPVTVHVASMPDAFTRMMSQPLKLHDLNAGD